MNTIHYCISTIITIYVFWPLSIRVSFHYLFHLVIGMNIDLIWVSISFKKLKNTSKIIKESVWKMTTIDIGELQMVSKHSLINGYSTDYDPSSRPIIRDCGCAFRFTTTFRKNRLRTAGKFYFKIYVMY